ncbi:MAG: DUF6816 family protein [Cyanobacteriota bacterium]
MATALMASILTALLTLLPVRATDWPAWSLPAPLPRPGQGDLVYPAWFEGRWQVRSDGIGYEARFRSQGDGVVGDRAFNAEGVGRALLGDQLLSVEDDPANPNRQIARLAGDLWLESTVVGRRTETSGSSFWADELALQMLHGPGEPRVSRVETLSRYQLEPDGRISGEQWQASYPSPALGLAAQPTSSGHYSLELTPEPPAPAAGPPQPPSGRAS